SPTLPTWCSPPGLYPIVSATSRVMQIGLSSESLSRLDLSIVAQYTIRQRLLDVPGVANVAIWGEQRKEVEVQQRASKMIPNRLSLNALLDAAANAVDAGQLT